MERTKTDWYLLFIFLFIAIGCSLLMLYYYVHHVNACVANPLEYYVEDIKENYYGINKVYGNAVLFGTFSGFLVPFGDNENKTITEFYIPQQEVKRFYNLTIDNKTYFLEV